MSEDELKRLRTLYDKMKEAANEHPSIYSLMLPWVKELHDILEPYAKD